MKKIRSGGYKGFVEHVDAWDEFGLSYGLSDLKDLALEYNTPLPIFDDKSKIIAWRFANGKIKKEL